MLVTLLTFLLPAGGAVVAIRNMVRLGEIDSRRAREMTIAVVVVFALGYTVLLLVSQGGAENPSNPSPFVTLLVSMGSAFAVYVLQQEKYRAWKKTAPDTETSRWYIAVGWALVYQFATALAAVPALIVIAIVTATAGK